MVARATALLVVVVLASVVALFTAPSAAALTPKSPYQSLRDGGISSQWADELYALMRGTGTPNTTANGLVAGESTAGKGVLKTALYRARVGARFLPKLGMVAGRLTFWGTAAYLTWRVIQNFTDGGSQTIDYYLDHAVLGKDALANPCAVPTGPGYESYGCGNYKWTSAAWVKESGPSTNCAIVGTADCWALELQVCYYWDAAAFGCGTSGTEARWIGHSASFAPTIPTGTTVRDARRLVSVDYCANIADCYIGQQSGNTIGRRNGMAWIMTRTMQNLIGREYTGATVQNDSKTHTLAGVGSYPSYKLMLRDDAIGPDLAINGAASSGTPDVTTTHTVPANAGQTTGDITNITNHFDSPCLQAFLNAALYPARFSYPSGCVASPPAEAPGPTKFDIPPPDIAGESYADYVARLREYGWTGTATKVTLAEGAEIPPLEPGAVVKVEEGASVWFTEDWPFPLPEIDAPDPLTITVNPGVFEGGEPGPDPDPEAGQQALPQPMPNETATQYRQRLRDLGFIGTITIVTADPYTEPPLWNPQEVVRIRIGSPTTTTVEIAAPWPAETPVVANLDDPITVEQAPPEAGPRSGEEDLPPGLDDGGGGYTCECPPIDFGPLSEVGATEKFPFGIFAWVEDLFDPLDGEEYPALAVSTPLGSFGFDMADADENIDIVRGYTDPIFQFIVIVASIMWLATSVIGIGRGGVETSDD